LFCIFINISLNIIFLDLTSLKISCNKLDEKKLKEEELQKRKEEIDDLLSKNASLNERVR